MSHYIAEKHEFGELRGDLLMVDKKNFDLFKTTLDN